MLVTATAAVHSVVKLSDQACYRRLIACFFGPLQETIACFFGPSSLPFSTKSAIVELRGIVKYGELLIFKLLHKHLSADIYCDMMLIECKPDIEFVFS